MHEKMAEWPIKKLVISMSGPAVISMTVQGLYNVVDGFFLARLGQSVITAIAIAIPFEFDGGQDRNRFLVRQAGRYPGAIRGWQPASNTAAQDLEHQS